MSDLYPKAAALQESLRLLEEVAEYLGRLPPNILTRDLKVKIDDHINQPNLMVNRTRLEAIMKDQEWGARVESGKAFTGVTRIEPNGLPVVQCLVIRGVVHLKSPVYEKAIMRDDAESAERLATEIGIAVAGGLNIQLRDVHDVLDKRLLKSWLQPGVASQNQQ